MTLGENLQKLRAAKGLSQEEVARQLYVSRQSVSKWENDVAEPGVENLKTLAKLYGVTLDQLLLGEDPAPADNPPWDGSCEEAEEPRQAQDDRIYLLWTGVRLAATVVVILSFFGRYGWIIVPVVAPLTISLITMGVGIWVRYPVMRRVILCLLVLDCLLSLEALRLENSLLLLWLAGDGVYLWGMTRPSVQRRFSRNCVR